MIMSSVDPSVQALLYFKDEQYREVFCKLPMVLLTNQKYENLTNNARVAYALLTSRFELSFKNNWIDDTGAIYFYYTTKTLAADVHVSERTAVKVRQELVAANLLNIQKQGLHKPARLYLLKPVIETSDFSKIEMLQAKDTQPAPTVRNEKGQLTSDAESACQVKSPSNQHLLSRDAKSARPDVQDLPARYINTQIKQDNTKPKTDTLKQDTFKSDTLKPLDAEKDTQSLTAALAQYKALDQDNSVFSETAYNLLQILSANFNQDVVTLSKCIFKAKDAALNNQGLYSKYLDLKDFTQTVEKTIYRILKQAKAGAIKDLKKYIFKTFNSEFDFLSKKYLIWCQTHQPKDALGNTQLKPVNPVTEQDLASIDSAQVQQIFG